MTKKLLFVTTLLLVFTLAALAADVNGKWVYEQTGMGGNTVTVTLTLKAEDGKLTGTMARPGRDGNVREMAIKDGKIDGDNVTFKTEMTFGDRTMTTEYSGTAVSAGRGRPRTPEAVHPRQGWGSRQLRPDEAN